MSAILSADRTPSISIYTIPYCIAICILTSFTRNAFGAHCASLLIPPSVLDGLFRVGRRDNLKEAMYLSAHLMLVIWMHSRLINTRQTALVRLITSLRLTYEGRMSAPCDVFFKEVTSGCITAVELYKTVANDLRQDGPFHPLEEFEVFDSHQGKEVWLVQVRNTM